MLMRLSSSNYTSFMYVLSFLREVLRNSAQNGVTAEHLGTHKAPCPNDVIGRQVLTSPRSATVFSRCLMLDAAQTQVCATRWCRITFADGAWQPRQDGSRSKQWRVMHHFITSPDFISAGGKR
jgi:hypothetical protein